MNDMKIFENSEFGAVRVVDVNGEPWFVAKDVCECLELGNPRTSIALLDEDEKGVHTMDTPGGAQEMSIVSEAGLYSLILRSRKPEAKAFKRWITHEVLPTIRRTGQYGGYALPRVPQSFPDALADQLGEGKHWKQVKAIPWLLEVFHESAGMYSQVGRKLSDLGARMGLSPRIKEDSQYGTVKIHHVEVIEALRLALKQDHNLLGKYRKMKAA